MTHDVDKLFICLFAIHVSSLIKYLFKSSDHFKILLAGIILDDTILKTFPLISVRKHRRCPVSLFPFNIVLKELATACYIYGPLMSQIHVTEL